MAYKRILVPLDGSSLSEAALPHAKSLAQSLDAELVLLRVIENSIAEIVFSDPNISETTVQEFEIKAQNYMKALSTSLENEGFHVSHLIRSGPIAEIILEVAAVMQVDLIAMSTHGRSGVQRWLLGSITERVVHHSPIPVMVIRPQDY